MEQVAETILLKENVELPFDRQNREDLRAGFRDWLIEAACVFTNTAPIDAYRGAGKPEANYLIKRLVDEAAYSLRIAPAVLRKRNFIRRFPYQKPFGAVLDSGDYSNNLDCVLATADRAGIRRRRAESRRRGKLRGFGIGCFLETARGAPDEDAWLTFLPDGSVSMAVGTQSNGQGHETSFAQVLSGLLGLPIDAFRLVQGDTARVPSGGGHGGARSLHMGGAALHGAAQALIENGRQAAAQLLQASSDTIVFASGWYHAPGAGEVDPATVARHVAISDGQPLSLRSLNDVQASPANKRSTSPATNRIIPRSSSAAIRSPNMSRETRSDRTISLCPTTCT